MTQMGARRHSSHFKGTGGKGPSRNIEIKARLNDPDGAERIAMHLSGSDSAHVLNQEDTYYKVPVGRLKLREMDDDAELIYYRRGDTPGPTASYYLIVPVGSPGALKEVLEACLGVAAVVRKSRRLYLAGSVRIHIDEVEGLGSFVEFEAVLAEGASDDEAFRTVRWLMSEFAIAEEDLVAMSYSDLVESGAV